MNSATCSSFSFIVPQKCLIVSCMLISILEGKEAFAGERAAYVFLKTIKDRITP